MSEWSGRFFLPGPTEVRPEVREAMMRPMIGHRTEEMVGLLAAAQPGLRAVLGTQRPVVIATCSATGLMEAAVAGGVERRALSLVNGAFSDRFRKIVESVGSEADAYDVEWGETHDPAEVERRLRSGAYDALTVVHSETSTGALNPLEEIAAAARRAAREAGCEILVLADGVSSVGGVRVRPDEWGVDYLLTGSQKALALPPGLAFSVASERYLARAARIERRGFYLDPVKLHDAASRDRTTTTPAISLLFALEVQMERMLAEGVDARFDRHARMQERCLEWAEARGITPLAAAPHRSPTVTSLRAPEGMSGPMVAAAAASHGYTIGAGYGTTREATFRIGHMGDHDLHDLNGLLEVLTEVIE